jgi:hypothetical protein
MPWVIWILNKFHAYIIFFKLSHGIARYSLSFGKNIFLWLFQQILTIQKQPKVLISILSMDKKFIFAP